MPKQPAHARGEAAAASGRGAPHGAHAAGTMQEAQAAFRDAPASQAASTSAAAGTPSPRRRITFAAGCLALAALLAGGLALWLASGTAPREGNESSPGKDAPLAVVDDRPEPPDGKTASSEPSPPPSIEDRLAALPSRTLAAADFDALSGEDGPFAFALAAESAAADDSAEAADAPAPALSAASRESLAAARSAFSDNGWSTGFLLIDLDSGRGLAANLGERIYGASSFKAPYALYLCETLVETGAASLESLCDESAARPFMDGSYLSDGLSAYPLGTLIENSIAASDNDSFRILRSLYDGPSFAAWLEEARVDPALATDEWYPRISACELGKLWLRIADYLDGESPTAAWLSALLERTETSYLRDALEGFGATVRDKAGWIASSDLAYNGMCDAGIVSKDGRDYLLCVMTSAPVSQQNAERVEALAVALWQAREDLAPQA